MRDGPSFEPGVLADGGDDVTRSTETARAPILPGMDLDTAPAQAARYRDLIGALSGARRLEIAAQLSQGVRALAEAGLRHRHPGASRQELRWRLAALLYGRSVAERIFGPLPGGAS